MRNYKRIRRIFENVEATGEQPMFAQPPAQVQPVQPAQELAPVAPEIAIEPALALPQTSSSSDPMVMTVKDFLEKVKSIEPLVAMGIESFIEKNMGSLIEPTVAAPMAEPDLSFSSQVQPAAPTQEPDLSFSSQVPAEETPAV